MKDKEDKRQMKILLLAFYKVCPPRFGAAVVTYNIIKFLSSKAYLIQLSDEKECRFGMSNDAEVISISGLYKNRFLKMASLILSTPGIIIKCKSIKPDFLIMEGASWVGYYLFYLWVFRSLGIKAKIVYHAHNVEYLLRMKKDNPAIAKISFIFERIILKKADLVFSVSETDSGEFSDLYGVRPFVLKNTVDTDKFGNLQDGYLRNLKDRYGLYGKTLLFSGLLDFKPNKEGLDFLFERVMPMLTEKNNAVKLVVIGGIVKRRFPWLINPGIIPFTDVPYVIKACDLCLAPIFSGSGVRLKILEYMAAAKPVISTRKGFEGIEAENGKNVIIAEKEDDFIREINFLLGNPELALQVGKEAKLLIEKLYSAEKIISEFEGFLTKELNAYPELVKEN